MKKTKKTVKAWAIVAKTGKLETSFWYPEVFHLTFPQRGFAKNYLDRATSKQHYFKIIPVQITYEI